VLVRVPEVQRPGLDEAVQFETADSVRPNQRRTTRGSNLLCFNRNTDSNPPGKTSRGNSPNYCDYSSSHPFTSFFLIKHYYHFTALTLALTSFLERNS
jgi:hypothetical protein